VSVRRNGRIDSAVSACVAGLAVAGVVLSVCVGCVSDGHRSNPQSDANRYLRLAQLQLRQGNTMKAIESTRKALDLDSDSAEAENFLGLIYLTTSEFKEALKHFKSAVDINPYYTDARNNLGVAYRELGRYDRSLAEFEEALKDRAYGTPEKIHVNMGHLYLQRGDHEAGIRSFREALAIRTDYPPALLGLGMAYTESGHVDQARAVLDKLVRLAPESQEAARARQMIVGLAAKVVP
jgi:type IV pilus assembly protein PilF